AELHVHGLLRVLVRKAARLRTVEYARVTSLARVAARARARGVGVVDPRSRRPPRPPLLSRRAVPLRGPPLLARAAARDPARVHSHRGGPPRDVVRDDSRGAGPAGRRPPAPSPVARTPHLSRAGRALGDRRVRDR